MNFHHSVNHATRDVQTTDIDSTPIEKNIHGVQVRKPTVHNDHRGRVLEIYPGTNVEDIFWEKPVVYSYMFTIRVNQLKGWGLHQSKDDRYTLMSGEVLIVLFDARLDSPTSGMVQKIVLSEQGNRQLLIPTGVWHCNINIAPTETLLVNHPTEVYKHRAPDRLLLPWDTDLIPVALKAFFPIQNMFHGECSC